MKKSSWDTLYRTNRNIKNQGFVVLLLYWIFFLNLIEFYTQWTKSMFKIEKPINGVYEKNIVLLKT